MGFWILEIILINTYEVDRDIKYVCIGFYFFCLLMSRLAWITNTFYAVTGGLIFIISDLISTRFWFCWDR